MKPADVIDGKYEVVRLLGKGGMGSVYEARHVGIGRRVALKVLHEDVARDPKSVKRFIREARAASAIGSKNIVEVTDLGEAPNGCPLLVLELLDGCDLTDLLNRTGPLEVGRATSFLLQACRALYAAHGAGIIHRDLKPGNLFLTRRDDDTELIKVLDFGIAKFHDVSLVDDPHLTATGSTLGTPYYMSPEQARGSSALDHRTDIYSLGVILYELLTGRPPFTASSFNELIILVATSEPRSPRRLRPDIPEDLERVILRTLSKEPADRFQSAAELADALRPFATDARPSESVDAATAPTLADSDSAGDTAPADGDSEGDTALADTDVGTPMAWHSGPALEAGQPVRPSRSSASAVVVIVLLVAGGVATLAWTLGGASTDPGAEERALRDGVTPAAEPPPRSDADVQQEIDGAAGEADVSSVRLAITARPEDARIRLDGEELTGNPHAGRRPRDEGRHQLEVSAPGHQLHRQEISLTEDVILTITLEPQPGPQPGGSARQPGAPLAPAGSPRPLRQSNPYGERE